MSKTTIRKRIAVVAVSALTAGILSVVSTPAANANIFESTNADPTASKLNVAVGTNTGAAVVTTFAAGSNSSANLRSKGLLYKDASSTTAQTATALTGGALVLYSSAAAATNIAYVASGGSFAASPTTVGGETVTSEYSADLKTLLVGSATDHAVVWNVPSTAGTYTISAYLSSDAANIAGITDITDGTLFGVITVTAVASSAGGTAVAAYGTCVTDDTSGAITSTADDTDVVTNGNPWYIKYILRDAYLAPLSSGNLVATATNGALISIGSGTQSAGTGSTVVAYGTGAAGSSYDAVRVDQPTSGAPLTTTVTITYNGATVCTKTVTIRGAADKMIIGSVGSVKIGGSTANANWLADGTNRDGHYTITLQDSAGNTVLPSSETEFSADSASLTTTVTALAVDNGDIATSTSSSTAAWNYSVGKFTCGPVAGTSKVTLKHTSASTGKIITAAFDARCAGNAYTYTASFDKASYTQGEIATLTVKFLDSKGNAANSQTALGASEMILPMMTFVSATGAASALAKADGTKAYTLTVGTTSGMTAGTYSGIIDFTGLTAVAATKQTVTYKVGTGSTDVAFTEVLKSVVALIASINKQIQALQKLILKR